MGDDDVQQPHHRGGGGHHFPVGSLVEVLVNEENMRCVYFSATVVPPPLFPRKSSTKNPGETLYVKYQTSVARKNGLGRLHEYVDVSSVRPAPPLLQKAAAKRFEPNDVVDAFHNDGWCEGVVSRVVSGGGRFVVTFENSPDELEFGPSALRAHWDWADGVWAGPKKKGKIGNPAFEAGAKVEISLDDFEGAWFPAAVVRDLGNGAYLVESKDRNGGSVEAEVDSVHIRPCPPNFRETKFEFWEKVDAFFDFGWWSGLIKEKVDRNAYIVFFEHTNLNRLLRRSELRPHMDWRDGEWFIGTGAAAKKSNDSGGALKKQNPQIENANQETELQIVEDNDEDDVVDQERRSKRKEDHMPIDGSTLLQYTSNSKIKRKFRALKKHKPPNDDANQEIEQIIGRHEFDQESIKPPNDENANPEIEKIIGSHEFDQESIKPPDENANPEIEKIIGSHPNDNSNQQIEAQGWPFVKRSVVWEAVESMEVFKKMPQRPHFEPLHSCKECEREGRAIGCMVTFSNLVETARSFKMSDPKSVVDELHETLLDLEGHGFEAGGVRELVVKLVAAKEEEQRLVDQAKRIKSEIEERRCRRSKIEGEMREINEHIGRLQEQLGISETARAQEVEGIVHLLAGLEESRQKMESLRCGIEGVAACVFQL